MFFFIQHDPSAEYGQQSITIMCSRDSSNQIRSRFSAHAVVEESYLRVLHLLRALHVFQELTVQFGGR